MITYELASLGNRIVSNLLDSVIVYVINFALIYLIGNHFSQTYYLLSSLGFVWLYHLVFAIFFGGITIGMRSVGIKPIKPDGGNVEFSDLFLRWVTRPLDLTFSLGALGILLMTGSEKRQRLGDMLAGTVMVHNRHSMHFSLNDILSFHDKNDVQQVRFPGVKYIRENDMLFIKNLLHNQAGYKSATQQKIIDSCSMRMVKLLELDEVPADKRHFLQTLVNDYIILTR